IDAATAMTQAKDTANEIASARDKATFADAVYRFAPEDEKAQYEKEMAQYQRDLAAYEAAIQQKKADAEAAEELAPETTQASRTRVRRRPATYSDMVEGETVESLPETPQWPQMDKTMSEVKKNAVQKKPEKKSGIVTRVASHLVEQDTKEIPGVNALPPRVNPQDAYKPAAKPEEKRRRS
ncbi:MAG: hypothetical protein IKV90_02025, partial [Clostridia bacterium]|nr:hypothetical protein [Clostridia bacterium]